LSAENKPSEQPSGPKKPSRSINLIVIGMAGSGKTTFMGSFYNYLLEEKSNIPYAMNLDPAVTHIPYSCHDDIRDQVNYKEVMKKYSLGPNGAIMTSLNLFSANFNNSIKKLEEEKEFKEIFLIDTPGQIEVFTWSASGQIISYALASTGPTAILFILDSYRCQNPNTFMSNMLFCCSILYKLKLPILVVFNKSDVADASIPIKWMKDYDSFIDAIKSNENYLSTLSRSMGLALDEFYESLNYVEVSSKTRKGMDDVYDKIDDLIKEYNEVFLEDLKESRKETMDALSKAKMDVN